MNDRVIVLTEADLHWEFGDQGPTVRLDRHGGYGRTVKVDPFPAYPHDPQRVADELARVEAIFPTGAPPYVYLLPREELSRSNGFEASEIPYQPDTPPSQKRMVTVIGFSAKRIPILPAMTRYLVAHEYGHAVEDWLKHRWGLELHDTGFLADYAKMRGLEDGPQRAYGGGVWANARAEVFANDFRVLVAKAEVEHWPHPGVPRPEEVRAVRDWWAGRLAEDRFIAEPVVQSVEA